MDVSNLFKSKTRKAVFSLYFTNPESEHYLRELERLLDIPVSMIRKELMRLEESGIFISRKQGNLTYYRLNKSYPLFDELKSIVFKTTGIKGLLKESLAKIKGIKTAFIYGSFARGAEKAMSDIDVLIIGDPSEDALVREINIMERALKREINYTLYKKEEFKKKKNQKNAFISDLISNPKIMLIGKKDDL